MKTPSLPVPKSPLLLFALLIAAACSRNAEVVSTPGGSASVIAGREWTLVSLRGEAIPAGGRPVTLRFDAANKRASGFAPCNQYGGPYTMKGDSLRFGPIVSTKMACSDNSRNQLEREYFEALDQTTSFELSDSILTLKSAQRDLARFRHR